MTDITLTIEEPFNTSDLPPLSTTMVLSHIVIWDKTLQIILFITVLEPYGLR